MTAEGGRRWRLYLLVVLVYLIWGSNFIVSKIALREIPGLVAASLRTLLASALMLPVYLWTVRQGGARPVSWRELPLLLGLGSIGVAVNQASFLLGVARTSAGNAALVIGLTPILVLLLAAALGQEKITARKLAGLSVAIVGVLLLQQGHAAGVGSWVGDLFMLSAAASFAVYTVFGKRATRSHGPIPIIAFTYLGGALSLLPFTWPALREFSFAAVSTQAWVAFLYMTVMSSTVSYVFFYYALSRLPASRVSAFAYLQPLVATLLAVPVLGEPITGWVVWGGSLVLAGVYLTERA